MVKKLHRSIAISIFAAVCVVCALIAVCLFSGTHSARAEGYVTDEDAKTITFNGEAAFDITESNGVKTINALKPESVALIDNYEKVILDIPDGIEVLADNAFDRKNGMETQIDGVMRRHKIVKVTMTDSVKIIGNSVFFHCKNLTDVTLSDSLTSIGSNAFYSLNGNAYTYTDGPTNDDNPDGRVKYIGKYLVDYSSGGTNESPDEYRIKDGTTLIAGGIFDYFQAKKIFVPKTVKYISAKAFYGAEAEEIIFEHDDPAQEVVIGEQAFAGCDNMVVLTLPVGVKKIPAKAFYGSDDLQRVVFPNTVTSLDVTAHYSYGSFEGYEASDLKSWLQIDLTGEYYHNIYVNGELLEGDIEVPEGVTRIGNYNLAFKEGITSVLLPSSLESIGDYAFYGYYEDGEFLVPLSKVTFKNKIEDGAVVGVDSKLTSIGDHAFAELPLVEFVLPSTVTQIGDNAFDKCFKLAAVHNLSGISAALGSDDCGKIAKYAVAVVDYYDGNGLFTDSGDYTFIVTREVVSLYKYNGSAESITLPETYEDGRRYAVNEHAFDGNGTIKYLRIEANSVTNIGASAFNACTALENVYIGAGIGTLGDEAFANCSALKSVTVVSGMSAIGAGAFYECESLTEVTLQNSAIEAIGDYAFYGCSKLLAITMPDTVKTVGEGAFDGCTSAVSLYIGNQVTEIKDGAFANTTSLTSAVIPDSVQSVGVWAFMKSGIKSVYIGKNVTTLYQTFYGCTQLEQVTFAEGCKVQDLGMAFYGALNTWPSVKGSLSLTSLRLPDNVTKIKDMLRDSWSIKELRLPASIFDTEKFDPGKYKRTVGGWPSQDPITYVDAGVGANYNMFTSYSFYAPNSPNGNGYPITDALTVYFPAITDATRDVYGKIVADVLINIDQRTMDKWGSEEVMSDRMTVYPMIDRAVVVLDDKASYDAVMAAMTSEWYGESWLTQYASSSYGATLRKKYSLQYLKDKIFYIDDVTYQVKRNGATDVLASVTERKLVSDGGADIRYTLLTDAHGARYYTIDEGFKLPEAIGAYSTVGGTWDIADVANTKLTTAGSRTFTCTVDALKITVPDVFRADYTGGAWWDSTYDGVMEIAAVNGDSAVKSVTDAGTYSVTFKTKDGCAFADGATEKTVTVTIDALEVELVWTWRQKAVSADETPVKTYDKQSIAHDLVISFADAGDETVVVNNDWLLRYKNGAATTGAAVGAAEWTLTVADTLLANNYPNYEFTHTTQQFRIENVVLTGRDISDGVSVDIAGSATLNDAMLYIYEDNSHNIIPSRTPLTGYSLVEVVNTVKSTVRYTNREWTLDAAVRASFMEMIEVDRTKTADEKQTAIGRQTTTFVLNALDNYEFALSMSVDNAAARGLTFDVSDDGKTLTLTKTWYVVQLANEIVKATFDVTKEPTDDDLYTIVGWTYGDEATVSLPRLWHGDEDASWQTDDRRVKFTLEKAGETAPIIGGAYRSALAVYVNKYMPAGHYTLTVTVDAFDTDNASYPTFSRYYEFDVARAEILIDETKLEKNDKTGYASYEWELTANANKELFFKAFADKINAAGVLKTVVMTAPDGNYWATDAGKKFFGNYTVSYNFARMNNERYEKANNNYLYEYIAGGARGTYTVYFQIEMPNHENLTDVGADGRYAYFFTVVVFETVDPVDIHVDNVTYTGLKNIPALSETDVYHVALDENDNYTDGGEHTLMLVLNDSVHYRWKGVAAGEVGLPVKYTVLKALNEFVESPDIVRWVEGKFSDEENGFIGAAKFGTISYVITDVNDKVIYDAAQGIDDRASMKAGTYILKATVAGNDNYSGLSESFTIRILEKVGLPWWGTLLIVIGALGVAALVIFILWKKGVFQILTGKLVLAIRTKATVDATIAAVHAHKKTEDAKRARAEAEKRERAEALREAAKAERNKPMTERAASLEAKAAAQAERAERMRARAEAMQAKAAAMKARAEQEDANVRAEAAATDAGADESQDR